MIRYNIEQNDIEGVAKFTRLLVGTVKVYKDDEPKLWAELEAIPKFTWDKNEEAAFEDEMKRREICLTILRKFNIFGYAGEPELGNSDALLDAVNGAAKQEEEEEVEA